ncbi:MAG: hypothetical protein QRY16_21970, partial [Enterobacterales bacterium endosymbiont of Blomia tropicalis]|uniref:hypothetical protein n=1 Tax=Mixta mediterraneensis TaxID=2758443 RepID=UPI0025A778A7
HFYAGYILALTDLIRVYDLNKNRCVKCYDFDLQECWTFSFPFFCARNQTVVLQDASHSVHAAEVEEKRQAKEEEILLDKFAREGRTREELSILLKKEDNGKAFNAIYRGSLADPDLSFLDVFTGRDSRLASVLKSCPGIKYSEIFNRLVSRKTGSNEIASKEIQDVCKKHYESLEKMYMKLLSYLNR